MVTVNNSDVVAVAMKRPETEIEGRGAMSYTPNAYSTGYLPERMRTAFYDARKRAGGYLKTFYSYGTPIAWLDGDTWVVPDVSYSITTARHQSSLWNLDNMIYVPRDASVREIARGVDRKMIYSRGYGGKLGTYRPGPNWTPKGD